MKPKAMNLQERAFVKLRESNLFQTYRNAFQLATGLSLELVPADEESEALPAAAGNRFCALLNEGRGCEACGCSHRRLLGAAEERPRSVTCFAGLKETAIPVRSGQVTIAFLRTGQVFTTREERENFSEVAEVSGHAGGDLEELEEAYLGTRTVSEEQYLGCVTLLNTFALQLSEELSRILIAQENSEPPAVTAAKQYVNAHLEEKIVLDAVASYVHVSPYYFCKLFKQSTGMTLTEFVNRRRVERAKRRLLNPQARVTEVAYDVGYQSLSQFNRSFLKYVGESPTEYRGHVTLEKVLQAA